MRIELFVGYGSKGTAAILFSPVLIFSLTRRHAIEIATYQWQPDRRAINLKNATSILYGELQ